MRRYLTIPILFFFIVLSGKLSAQATAALRDSLAAATERLAYHPDSIDLRLKKGSWNIMLEQWAYAQDEYDKVLKLDPNNVAALYYRAYVNEKQGRYSFARLDYENLLKLVPGNFEARLGLALLNQKDKHYTEAYDQINMLLQQNPDSAIAYAARGGIEKDRKMYESAEWDYTKAIELAPDIRDYLLNRADIRMILKKPEAAKADLDLLVKKGMPKAVLGELYKKLKLLN